MTIGAGEFAPLNVEHHIRVPLGPETELTKG